MLKRTALYECHAESGARFVDFGGWDMPVQYAGTLQEHAAVREHAGMFDVSHMGEVVVRGPEALAAVNRLISNDLERIPAGRAQYTVMCKPDGGIVDDLIVYKVSDEELFLCVNASNREKDFSWIQQNLSGDATARDESDDWSQIALQGPRAMDILEEALPGNHLGEMKPFRFMDVEWKGHLLRIATTGYTGSGGVEVYLPNEAAPLVWRLFLEVGAKAGLQPAGLGARDTLRLEKGYCLYGNDIDETTHPLEAGLEWVVRWDKGDFVGRKTLLQHKESGVKRRLIAFSLLGKGVPRGHYPVYSGSARIGEVTSGNMSPVLKKGIGLAYVPIDFSEPGSVIEIDIRGRKVEAVVERLPFL